MSYAHYVTALVHTQRGELREAREACDKAVSGNFGVFGDTASAVHFLRGALLRQLGELEASLESLEKASAMEPYNVSYFEILASVQLEVRGVDEQLVARGQEFYESHPEDVSSMRAMALIAEASGEHALLLRVAEKLIAASPSSTAARRARCQALLFVDHVEAVRCLDEVCTADPFDGQSHIARVLVLSLSPNALARDPQQANEYAQKLPTTGLFAEQCLVAKAAAAAACGHIDEFDSWVNALRNEIGNNVSGPLTHAQAVVAEQLRLGKQAWEIPELRRSVQAPFLLDASGGEGR
jgi:tetratricopeptide (TPR) repeat protein